MAIYTIWHSRLIAQIEILTDGHWKRSASGKNTGMPKELDFN